MVKWALVLMAVLFIILGFQEFGNSAALFHQ